MNLNNVFDKSKNDKPEWKKSGKSKPKRSLVKEIEESIVAYNKAKYEPSDTMFRASGVGACNRKLMYKELGVEGEEIDAHSFAVMNVGTYIHTMVQDWLGEKLESLEQKVYFDKELLGGSYDGVFHEGYFVNGEKDGFELKTTNVENYQRLLLNPSPWQLSSKYKYQANMYLYCLGLKRQRFIFFNRNVTLLDSFIEEHGDKYHPFLLEIVYERDEEIIEKIRQRINDNKKAIDKFKAEENPDILDYLPEYKKCSECSYCPYEKSGRCKSDHEEQKIRKRLLKKKLKEDGK
jgi:hypothetical protein